MTNDKLPVDVKKNIWSEAERYAEEKVKAVNEEHFNVYNAYIAGATAWAYKLSQMQFDYQNLNQAHKAVKDDLKNIMTENNELKDQAQRMADALEWIKTYGPVDKLTVKVIDKALQQFKDGKEVGENG